MKETSKVVVFDLEETLGHFRELTWFITDKPISIFLRPELEKGLSLLSDYELVVATTNVSSYADIALRSAGVRNHFAEIYDVFDFKTEDKLQKSFKPIARDFEISEVSQNILFVGNNYRTDHPEDGSNIVFIKVDEIIRSFGGPRTNMPSLAKLIKDLDVKGGFNSGFHSFKTKNMHPDYIFYENGRSFREGEERVETKTVYTPQIWTSMGDSPIEKISYTMTIEEVKTIKEELAKARR